MKGWGGAPALFQLHMYRLSLHQDEDVGICAVSEAKEVLVRRAAPGLIALKRVGACQAELRLGH